MTWKNRWCVCWGGYYRQSHPFVPSIHQYIATYIFCISPTLQPQYPPPPKFPSLSHQHERNCRGGAYTVTSSSSLNLCPRNHRKKVMGEILHVSHVAHKGENLFGGWALATGLVWPILYISQLPRRTWGGGGRGYCGECWPARHLPAAKGKQFA